MMSASIPSGFVVGMCTLLLGSACSAVRLAEERVLYDPQEEASAPAVRGTEQQISALIGARTIDDFNDLDDGVGGTFDIGDHVVLGGEFSTVGPSGLGWEAGLHLSTGDDTVMGIDVDLTFVELTAGGRYTFSEMGPVRPYVGAGVDLLEAELTLSSGGIEVSDDESDFGYYAHVGANVPVAGRFALGADVRGLFGTSDDFDYVQFVLQLTWGL